MFERERQIIQSIDTVQNIRADVNKVRYVASDSGVRKLADIGVFLLDRALDIYRRLYFKGIGEEEVLLRELGFIQNSFGNVTDLYDKLKAA